jgi:hypothetical protein
VWILRTPKERSTQVKRIGLKTLLLAGMLTLVVMGGSASAKEAEMPRIDSLQELVGVDSPGLCLDLAGACNDVQLEFMVTTGADHFLLAGHEYGCGHSDRLLTGTMRRVGSTYYINYLESCTVSCSSYRQCGYSVQLSASSGSGPVQYYCNYGTYHSGDGTASVVPCTALEATGGADLQE